ncbi:CZB domain-containing protein [Rhabdochromatium marinum]|uniref:CZB domain-containing protein n=1 Tax=Rhabdochromatium marinum TaxID=48729 RepID=UPI003B837546
MEQLARESATLQEGSVVTRELAHSSRATIGELAGRFAQFSASAKDTLARTDYALDKSFATLVKVDHVIYKQRAYMALDTNGEKQYVDSVSVDDHHCRLGQWYEQGDGKRLFSAVPSFNAMAEPHRNVHGSAHHLLDLIADGAWQSDSERHERIHAALESMEHSSIEVMDIIDRMVDEKHV